MVSRPTFAPAWACPTRRNRLAKAKGNRHCERSEAIHGAAIGEMDCFATLAMTRSTKREFRYVFVEIRHRRLWRHRLHRPARRGISRRTLQGRCHPEMGDGRAQQG